MTQQAGVYGAIAWSPDGQQLLFSNVTHCTPYKAYRGCSDLRSLNFVLAKNKLQTPRKVLGCSEQNYDSATWISNDEVAFIESRDDKARVMSLSLGSETLKELYASESHRPYSIDYSRSLDKLAITQFDPSRDGQLVFLTKESNNAKITSLKVPNKYRNASFWDIKWDGGNPRLLAAKDSNIFTIDLEGNFRKHSVLGVQGIWGVTANFDNTHLAASVGVFDLDIAEMSWQTDEENNQYNISDTEILERAIVSE